MKKIKKQRTKDQTPDGTYMMLNRKRTSIVKHPTDFSVIDEVKSFAASDFGEPALKTRPLGVCSIRVSARDEQHRDDAMESVRAQDAKYVAHHIYASESTGEEIIIDDHILLTLRDADTAELEEIKQKYHLTDAGRMGEAYILRVTAETGMNPVKTANIIAAREEVYSCSPQVLIPLVRSLVTAPLEAATLLDRQWHLGSAQAGNDAGIGVREAWAKFGFGSEDIVIAVIDDGFDIHTDVPPNDGHPAFRQKKIDPNKIDFVDGGTDPIPKSSDSRAPDFHGTPVASIATASLTGGAMIGVAPGCTLLPIRVDLNSGSHISPKDLLDIFSVASLHADVANCSFTAQPTAMNLLQEPFSKAIHSMTISGGRRKKGLVIVFGAGNDDAPTQLKGEDNKNGVVFVDRTRPLPEPTELSIGKAVNTRFQMIPGVAVVGAVTSGKRKAGYSNWGPHITLVAPSNNFHDIVSSAQNPASDEIKIKFDKVRPRFEADYPGLALIAAINTPPRGDRGDFLPLPENSATAAREHRYTAEFGGTSGAAPIVAGIAALMLSVNDQLTAAQVISILQSTADKENVLDSTLDLKDDPNLQGVKGDFVNGRSAFFGAGRVNALRALEQARNS